MRTLEPISFHAIQSWPAIAPYAESRRPFAGARSLATVALVLLLAIFPIASVQADVIVNGSVSPADNPFTTNTNEGLPFDGNGIDEGGPPNAEGQPTFEGLSDIIVGVSGPGDLTINNGSFLRYLNLIIGDSMMIGTPGSEQTLIGEGLMRIVGVGAYYNNDPAILPAGFPEDFGSRRVDEMGESEGFDLYVGRAGFGVLEIVEGARAEIEDAVILGDSPIANGHITVDGIGSHLSSGGFSDEIGVDEVHQVVVGRFGFGTMTISNGGRVLSDAGGDTQVVDFVGAVIGGEAYLADDAPMPGGEGAVLVTGPLSRWTNRASLQVGGFHNEDGVFGPELESEGDNVVYGVNVGKGTLTVADGALVTVLPIDSETPVQTLKLAIGERGRVNLAGGRINVGTNVGDTESGVRDDLMQVLNDGVIVGAGRIDTGVFRNRYRGQVEVRDGQHLIVGATAGFEDPDEDAPPMINWGVIRVLGNPDFKAELEFDRPPSLEGGLPAPFENRLLTSPPLVGRTGGLIHVQDGVLRFRSGLANQASVAFTGGDNLVVGDVLNLPGDGMLLTDGVIAIDGIGTHVVFEDNLDNGGVLDIAATVAPIDVLGEFSNTGTLQLELTSGLPFRLNIVDDAILDGILQVSLLGLSPSAGDSFGLLSATGELSGIFTGQILPTLGTDLGWTVDYDYDVDTVTLKVLSTAMVMGADFNGDGVVNLEDLAILEMNLGITMGATALQGDADGDGDVDGSDYDIWLMTMMPGAGAGAGHEGLSAVPEPSGLVLAVLASVLAAAVRRGRQ
jgi:T5SS/PEP-CTERM-associated repeat protein